MLKNSIKTIGQAILPILFIVSLTGCGGGGGDGGVAFTCGDSEAVYVRMDADDSNAGTISEPLKTIQAAVACAVPGQDIRIANGTYNANMNNRIILTEGKSIYGGYSSDYQVRDPAIYPTIITDVTDLSMGFNYEVTPVLIDSNTTTATVLDGFTIKGSTIGIGISVGAILINNNGSPTISNNIIEGGGSNLIDSSRGIFINSSSIIKNNIINGGNGLLITVGVSGAIDGGVISANTINSGTGAKGATYGIDVTNTTDNVSTINNNKITVGHAGSDTFGINVGPSSVPNSLIIIEGNTVTSGTGSSIGSTAVRSAGVGKAIIRNNTLVLEGITSYGVHTSSNSIISNNTIVGGGSFDAWGIYNEYGKTATPTIQNNVIDLANGACIAESPSSLNPLLVKNNDLTGCATLYLNDGATNITNIDDVNALSDTDASGNVSIPPGLDSAQDYRLTGSSPIAVTQGGLDLSSDFNTDKAGNLRTVPWSMGAYEYD